MKDFLLEIAFSIIGVGAASGLFYRDNSIYLISDDSNYLYTYSIPDDTLSKTLLTTPYKINEQLPKYLKSDFEAIAFDESNFYVYGSGSSSDGNRDIRVTIDITGDESIHELNLTSLYRRLQEKFLIDTDNFNIEGAIHHTDHTYLFNRGNGPRALNGIFSLGSNQDTMFTPVALPLLNGVKTGFTDAILVDDTVYFLAAAEDAGSVYHDGVVQGTILGKLSFPDLALQAWVKISDSHKFEGLTLLAENDETITFFLCEDPDDGTAESTIYKLSLLK